MNRKWAAVKYSGPHSVWLAALGGIILVLSLAVLLVLSVLLVLILILVLVLVFVLILVLHDEAHLTSTDSMSPEEVNMRKSLLLRKKGTNFFICVIE